MRRLIPLTLCLLMLCAAAMADRLTWTVPEGLTAYGPEDAGAAEALHTDPDMLRQALRDSGTVLLLTAEDGTLYQLTAVPSAIEGLDFSAMGKKKIAILAETLAASGGQYATTIHLTQSRQTASPTDSPRSHRATWWILLRPKDDSNPRTLTLISALRGTELTLYVTVSSSGAEDTALAKAQELLLSLLLDQEQNP